MASTASVPPRKNCRCCPYGFHIDLDFVNFAEDVVKGQSRTGRTPTLSRKQLNERALQSPMESIFSDSLENIMSDFEEVLDRQYASDLEGLATNGNSRQTNGYSSDYTGHKSHTAERTNTNGFGHSNAQSNGTFSRNNNFGVEFNSAPPKPTHRPTNGARGQILKNASAYTALGRTINEIKQRQSMETLIERSESSASRSSSRLCGTPIDLGLTQHQSRTTESKHHGTASCIPPRSPRQDSSPSSQPSWRRGPFTAASSASVNRPSDLQLFGSRPDVSTTNEFTSLRRGREPTSQRDGEGQHRVRYYSASPKISRRFAAAPSLPFSSSEVSYSDYHTNPHRTEETNKDSAEKEYVRLLGHVQSASETLRTELRTTRSIGVTTGPIPPVKPCTECPSLKSRIQLLVENPPIPSRPEVSSVSILTDPEPVKETRDAANGIRAETMNIAIGTESKMKEKSTLVQKEPAKESQTQTSCVSTVHVSVFAQPVTYSIGMNTDEETPKTISHFGVNTEGEFVPAEPSDPEPEREFSDSSTCTEEVGTKDFGCGECVKTCERETSTIRLDYRSFDTQTTEKATRDSACSPIEIINEEEDNEEDQKQISTISTVSIGCDPIDFLPSTSHEKDVQTDEQESNAQVSGPRVLTDSEIADSLWLMPEKEMVDCAVGSEDVWLESVGDVLNHCENCLRKEKIFMRNVGVGVCCVSDKVCAMCDTNMEVIDENEVPGFTPERTPERLPLTISSATKKLLTSEQKENHFVRGTVLSKSCRLERTSPKQDSLEFITEQHKKANQKEYSPSPITTPSVDTTEALKVKVALKKEIPPPPSEVPEPIPARIPRPKISKYVAHNEAAVTPDEEDEAADRLTPLRSELRSLGRWGRNDNRIPYNRQSDSDDEENLIESDGSEGTYDCQENEDSDFIPFVISTPFREAFESLNSHLIQPGSVTAETADWALKYVQHEWLKMAARKNSQAAHVEGILEVLKELSPSLVRTVVNITDQNGNTSLHYAVSHCNFSVVSCLLDCGHCQLNLANKAGYTPVMLAALSNLENEVEKTVVHRLFQMGDVNARATQHGQTALMLAVSHGKKETTELLLETKADVNVQDEEGSTALMCAAEHGHRELVKMLLATPCIDASLTDCDSSTALSIAVENGHRDIGVLIYAHLNYTRADSIDEVL